LLDPLDRSIKRVDSAPDYDDVDVGSHRPETAFEAAAEKCRAGHATKVRKSVLTALGVT
jgi:hypothetical protein